MTFAALSASSTIAPGRVSLVSRRSTNNASAPRSLVTVAVRPPTLAKRARRTRRNPIPFLLSRARARPSRARYRSYGAPGPVSRVSERPRRFISPGPPLFPEVAMSSDASVLPHRTPQGTGKGYGRHVHKKDSTMDIDYAKHVPGYDRMSRPQKYRARKSVKQVRFFVFRARGTHVDEIPGGFRFHVASLRFVPLTPPRNPPRR